MEEAEAFKNMYDYIANLNPEDKVTDEQYEQRLLMCRQCEHLLSGMLRGNAGSHENKALSGCSGQVVIYLKNALEAFTLRKKVDNYKKIVV